MFYREQSNQYISEGTSFSIDGTSYPSNWLNLTSPEEKAALGLVEVTDANSPEDGRFYWVSDTLVGAVRTYLNTQRTWTCSRPTGRLRYGLRRILYLLLRTTWTAARLTILNTCHRLTGLLGERLSGLRLLKLFWLLMHLLTLLRCKLRFR